MILSAAITAKDDKLDMAAVMAALGPLGTVHVHSAEMFHAVDVEGMRLHREVWLYVSNDEDQPYAYASGAGEPAGEEVATADLELLRQKGVCILFHAEYANADKYGAPAYAGDDDFACGFAGLHGFKVPMQGLRVHASDRGDDGTAEVWLKIAVPDKCLQERTKRRSTTHL
jgi:hypothetical protein